MSDVLLTPDPLLLQAVDQLLAAAADDDAATWPAGLWRQAADMGLTGLCLPEAAGGSGGTVIDAVGVLHVVGRHASALPLAESMLTAGWVLSRAGRRSTVDPVTIAMPWRTDMRYDAGRLSGRADGVAWARQATKLVVTAAEDRATEGAPILVFALDRNQVSITPVVDLAGLPRDSVSVDSLAVEPLDLDAAISVRALRRRALVAAVAQAAGGIEALSTLSATYANARTQFGQPIARFQAVQQHLVTIEQQAVLMSMAARQAACAMHEQPDADDYTGIAAAVVAASAIPVAVRAAHQVHGAIGLTREYPLHRTVRFLHALRAEHLAGRANARLLGLAASHGDAESLYPLQPQISECR